MGTISNPLPDSRLRLAVKSADQTLTSENTTPQTITGMTLEIGASSSEVWQVEWYLLINTANITMDGKLGIAALPSGASIDWDPVSAAAGNGGWQAANTSVTPVLQTGAETMPIGSREGKFGIAVAAIIFGGGTAGNVDIQFSQNTSNAGAIKVLKGSFGKYFMGAT